MVLPKRWLPRWRTGCGCCTLETCCNVQGYIYLVGTFAVAVLILVGMCSLQSEWACAEEMKIPLGEWFSLKAKALRELCGLQQMLFVILSTLLVFYIIAFGATVSYLRGIYKREAHMLIMYNWNHFVHLVFDIIFLFWGLFRPTERWSYLLSCFFMIGLNVYMLLCSETLYHQLQEASLLVNEDDGEGAQGQGGQGRRAGASATTTASTAGSEPLPPAYSPLGANYAYAPHLKQTVNGSEQPRGFLSPSLQPI